MYKEFKVTSVREIVVTAEDIDDIMCAALEGGINYWCCQAEVMGDYLGEYGSEQISRGGVLRLHLIEPFDKDDTKFYDLTLEKFLEGLKMYIDGPYSPYDIVARNPDGYMAVDPCQCDADVADMIVQYALWKDQIFA